MSQHQKIILFNGPPRVGKDTAVRLALGYLFQNAAYLKAQRMSFADPLKRTTHQLYGVFESPTHFAGENKDEPTTSFFGKTPREAYIEVSEKMVKPVLGDQHWGRVASVYMQRQGHCNLFLFSDSGFVEELRPLVMRFGPTNIAIVELTGTRDGEPCTFVGDSRDYIGAAAKTIWPAITTYRIPNTISTDNPDLTLFNTLVCGVVKTFLKLDID